MRIAAMTFALVFSVAGPSHAQRFASAPYGTPAGTSQISPGFRSSMETLRS